MATSFEVRLHPVGPRVRTVQALHPIENAGDVLRYYRELMAEAPDELTCYAIVANVPPLRIIPRKFHGCTAVVLIAAFFGDDARGKPLLKRIRAFGDPIVALHLKIPYTILQRSFDATVPEHARYYYKSQYLTELTDAAIDLIATRVQALPGRLTRVGLEPMGGATNRVDPTATAYPHRDARFNFGIWTGWEDQGEDDAMIRWTRDFHREIIPHASEGNYVNYLADDDADRVQAAYGINYERLTRVKAAWDPENLSWMNHNIPPAALPSGNDLPAP